MPRPGQRPYECVRRAWHSDRQEPIRGSLIQEIFRVVDEVHSPATKKNKEWQEKLPIVVLKAEEIMYSKANSEAEYMDLKTLWDRTTDAINTIIRRDESTESGELLQPCIEAALNLGCIPRRASRSQRNTSPRCYLSPGTQELKTFSPGMAHNTIQANHTVNSQCIPSNFIKPMTTNSTHLGSESQNLLYKKNNVTSSSFLFAADTVPVSNIGQSLHVQNNPTSRSCSIYPLYYGSCVESHESLSKSVPSTMEPAELGGMQNLFPKDASVKIGKIDVKDSPLDFHEIGCDLSLRLGSLATPMPNNENCQLKDAKNFDSVCSHGASRFNDQMPQMDVGGPLDSCLDKFSDHVNLDLTLKKRKVDFDQHMEDQRFCWWPKIPCNHLTGGTKSAGS